ncbi:hypothetical protein [Streptomyces sp. NPDC020951]|uniref:hypothetical protein n=1 Tax=Streptomyces sp. NPDC020951 TaxID=3365104 RepID=UPI0037A111A3
MTTPITQVVAEHLSIWNSPAGEERSRAIASTYAGDVLVAEAEAVYQGHDGVEKAIDALHAAIPGMQLKLSGVIQTAQELSTYSWTLGPPEGAPVVTGRDVIVIKHGVLESVYVLIDAPQ